MRPLLAASCLLILTACTPVVNINLVPGREQLKAQPVYPGEQASRDQVAIIDVRGALIDAQLPGLLSDAPNPVDRFVAQLHMAEKDQAIKGVIVRITSPGGTVTASDIMHQELVRFRRESGKPVVASIGEVGASGGYYLALAADRLYAEPTAITGSVGVIMPTINFSQGMAKLGIVSRSVKSGANKDLANPLEPMRDSQYAVLQRMVDDMYARFRGLVAERRPGINPADLGVVTDGSVFTGVRAKELGLIDETGGVREAFEETKRLAGLKSATLVKFASEGLAPRSAYSVAPSSGDREINLVQLNLPAGLPAGASPGAMYYLWVAPQP